MCRTVRTSQKSSAMSWEATSLACRKVSMADDLSGESLRGGVLGSRHGSTNICAAVRSMLGKNGGRTTIAGRTDSWSRATPSLGVASLIVCAVGVSESDKVVSWKSMISSWVRRLTRSRSWRVDIPAGKLAMALRISLLYPLGERLRCR